MSNYILDTNIISTLGAEGVDGIISNKLTMLSDSDNVYVSIITLYEENYGLKNSNDKNQQERFKQNIDLVQQFFQIVSLDIKEMNIYADLKVAYKKYTGITKKDVKKNDLDLLIASTAIAMNAILVSNDKIFKTLTLLEPRLKYENWLRI